MFRKSFFIAIFYILYSIFFPTPTLAEDLLPYFNPSTSCTNSISNGEQFTNKPSGGGFIIQKSADPAYYERFGYDSENIYHYEDTTWATGNNENVKCNGTGDDATMILFRGSFGSSQNVAAEAGNHTADLGMIWIKRNMAPGECFSSEATVVGKNKRTGQYCDTPYSGPGAGHTLCMSTMGPICLSTGYVMKNGVALTVTGGAGSGEQYYYDKKSGWVGFGDNLATSSSCGGGNDVAPSCTKITSNPNRGSTTGSGGTAGRCTGTYEGPLRPNAYSVCKISSVPEPVNGTVDSFEVSASISMHIDKIMSYPLCDGKYYPTIDWDTQIMENYSQTKLPMAGWGKSPALTEINSSIARPESSYLADYLEGTGNYDRGNLTTFEQMQTKAGVYRKLTPSWLEDKQKCDMIKAVKANKQENYLVKINVTSGDLNFIQKLFNLPLSFIATFLNANELNLRDFTCITDPTIKISDLTNLNLVRSKLLWEAVPMFTREDTPGRLGLSPQNPPGSLSPIGGDGVGNGSVNYPLSIPHVARLNAISQTTTNMMLPSALQNTSVLAEIPSNQPIIAQSSSPPPNNLLAQANCEQPFIMTIDNISYSNGKIYYSVGFDDPSTDGPQCHLYVNGQFWGGCINDGGVTRLDAGSSSGLIEPITGGPDGSFSINVSAQLDNHKPCGFTSVIGNNCKVTMSGGKVDTTKTTCGPATPPTPTPTPCGYKGAFSRPPTAQGITDPKDPKYLDSISKTDKAQKLTSKSAVPDGGISEAEAEQTKQRCDLCISKAIAAGKKDPEGICAGTCNVDITYTTGVSTSITLPYLKTIWKQEARDKKSGLFNFLTPGGVSGAFTKVDSKSKVTYGVDPNKSTYTVDGNTQDLTNVTINPTQGSVLFPYLQGIYDAQTCVSQSLLLPAQFAKNVTCPRLY